MMALSIAASCIQAMVMPPSIALRDSPEAHVFLLFRDFTDVI
jgi:hypothetical protein